MDEGKLFSDIKFVIAQCNNVEEIKNILIEGGAKHINYLSEHVTHVIADTNCSEADEAIELFDKPVVNSLWVHLSIKAKKLLPKEAFSPIRHIFHHVIASFSSDLSQHDIDVLAATLTFYGARVSKQVDQSTHFIVASADSIDYQNKKFSNNQLKVVAPDWVLESVKQNYCCEEQLFDPSLLLPPLPPTPPQIEPEPEPELETDQHKACVTDSNEQKTKNDNTILPKTQSALQSHPQVHPQHNQQQLKLQSSHVMTPNRSQVPERVQIQPQHQIQSQPQSQVSHPMQQIQPHPPTQLPRPRMPTNVIRGVQPKFRPILPPNTSIPMAQRTTIPQQPRVLAPETQQPKKVTINYGQYRKPGPYPNDVDSQQQVQIHPQQTYAQHVPNQQPAVTMGQPSRLPQPNMYHQVRGPYQNSHIPTTGPPQQSMMNPQQPPQQQMINRFQESNTHMGVAQRPYQVPLQSQQSANPNYHQGNMQRQSIYYPQGSNHVQTRMQGPPIRHAQSDQVVYDNFNHPQHLQDPSSAPHQQHYQSLPSQQTHQQPQMQQLQQPQSSIAQPRPPYQTNLTAPCAGPHSIRPVRIAFNNQQESNATNIRLPIPSQGAGPQTTKIPANIQQPQPHPSIFDHIQESNLAQIRAKVPIVTENINYYGHDRKENVPKDLPFTGCCFKFIDYDDICPKQRENWCDAIRTAGGTFSENLEGLTHLICENRLSTTFSEALKIGIRCVTIYWVNDVLAQDRMTFPYKALHLPVPFSKNKKPLTDQLIATTNLKGRERKEVREMLFKLGAKVTGYFSPSNSLIICGNVGGDKYERAIEWRIPIANCRLLSDILLKEDCNLNVMLTQSKYQIFNRGDPLKLNSYSDIRELMNPWTKPLKLDEKKDKSTFSGFNGAVKTTAPTLNANDDSGIVTCGSNNSDLDTTNGKLVATQLANPVNGQTTIEAIKEESKSQQETESEQKSESNDVNREIDTEQITKAIRKSTDPVRILFTNLDPSLVKQLETYALELGLGFASGPTNCTHLIVDGISRTRKFICAFSHASHIVSYKWLVKSYETKNLLEEKNFILQDREGEERFSFNLVYSLMKRRKRGGLLFSNHIFFVTPSVLSEVSSLKEMIESAGGVMATRKPPTKMQMHQMRIDGKRLVAVTCDQDLHLCSTLVSYGVDIVTVEFVISGILRQDIDFEAHRIKTNDESFTRPETTQISQSSPPKKLKLDNPFC